MRKARRRTSSNRPMPIIGTEVFARTVGPCDRVYADKDKRRKKGVLSV